MFFSLMERLDPRRSLAAAVAWEVTAITLFAALIASFWFSFVARNSVKDQIGAGFRQYATQISNELDVNLYSKLQALQSVRAAASFFIQGGVSEAAERARGLFPRIRDALPELEWIGYAGPDGKVLAAVGDPVLESVDVSQKKWYQAGKQAAWIGDAHDAAAIQALAATRDAGAAGELVDLSVPVFDGQGKLLGVIGAKLGVAWLHSLEAGLRASLRAPPAVEILLVMRDGTVLMGPEHLLGHKVPATVQEISTTAIESVARALTEHKTPPIDATSGQRVLDWQDGSKYLTGFATSEGNAIPGGTGWTVWVRESTQLAFAPIDEQWRQNLITIALLGVVTAVAGAIAARRLTRRLVDIAKSADDIRAGTRRALQVPPGADEAARIGRSLQELLDDLERRNHALEQLNVELDARVAARTREVEKLGEESRQAALVRERLRFARDLHDTLAHSIMELLSQIRLMRKRIDDPEELMEELARAEDAAREGLQRARAAISELRRDVVRDLGLGAGLRQLLNRVGERHGIAVEYAADAKCESMADNRAETLCRIAEEALRNIEQHAHARQIKLTLHAAERSRVEVPETIVLTIEDDGAGFDTSSAQRAGHYGLRGMRELADTIGASLSIASEPGSATRVTVMMPA
jgi:signal transduction histidine kinase